MVNGRLPVKVVSIPAYVTSDPVAIIGIVLTSATAAACSCVVQDAQNNDIVTLNTTTSNGVSAIWFPVPMSMKGLSVPALSGSGAIVYIYLAAI